MDALTWVILILVGVVAFQQVGFHIEKSRPQFTRL
jgi:hypothetical protein